MCLHACYSEVLLYFEIMFSGVHQDIIIKLIYMYMKPKGPKDTGFIMDK